VPRATAKIAGSRPPRLKGRISQWLHARFQRGKRNEARTLQEAGLTKNNRTVEGRDKNGDIVRTIPDSLPTGRVVEVKDVKFLSYTRQIRGQHSFATNNGRKYEIFTGNNTILSGTMQSLVKAGKITIIPRSHLGLGD